MVNILLNLKQLDNETRMKLLPREQEIIKEWETNGTLVSSYIKQEIAGIYLVLMANDAADADAKLSTLPYYPYMEIEIEELRVTNGF